VKVFYESVGFCGTFSLDDYPHEREVNEKCRAKFVQHPSGHVDFLGFEWNAARVGKPDIWMPIAEMLRYEGNKLAADIKGMIDEEDARDARLFRQMSEEDAA
jgi:hypothetical protein